MQEMVKIKLKDYEIEDMKRPLVRLVVERES